MEEKKTKTIEFDLEEFNRAIALTSHARDADRHRTNLDGFHVVMDGEKITVETTDGYRLVRYSYTNGNGVKFPDVSNVIPKGKADSITFNIPDLRRGINAIITCCPEKIKAAAFRISDNEAIISTEPGDEVTASVSVPCEATDKPMRFGINAVYLLETISAISNAQKNKKSSSIVMEYRGELKPLKWTVPHLSGFEVVFMPLRLEWL